MDCPSELDPVYQSDFLVWTPTAPATVMADFEPQLPGWKEAALRRLRYDASTKVLLAFQSPFWERNFGNRNGGYVLTDLPVQTIYYPSTKTAKYGTLGPPQKWNYCMYMLLLCTSTGRAVLLASYSHGLGGGRLGALSDAQVIDECLEAVARAHNVELKYVQMEFLHGRVKKWAGDPLSMGGVPVSSQHHVRDYYNSRHSVL